MLVAIDWSAVFSPMSLHSNFSLSKVSSLIVLWVFILLSGCGVPGSGGGSDFDNPDRESGDPELEVVEVPITVEATSKMMQQAAGSENIITVDNINCALISVVQLGFDLQENRASDLPDFTAKKRADFLKPNAPGCKLEFVEI